MADIDNLLAQCHPDGDKPNRTVIPRGSVKRVVKLDKNVKMVSAEAVYLISKATVRNLTSHLSQVSF